MGESSTMDLLLDQDIDGVCSGELENRPVFGELNVKFKREHIVLLLSKGLWEREKANTININVDEIG